MPDTTRLSHLSSSASGRTESPHRPRAGRAAIDQPPEIRRAFKLGSLLVGLAALGVGAGLWRHGIEGLETSVVVGATMLLGLAGACVLSGYTSESFETSLQTARDAREPVAFIPRSHPRGA